MKNAGTLFLGIILAASLCWAEDNILLTDQQSKESYSLGYQFGQSLKQQKIEINLDIYAAGIRDAINKKEPLLSNEDIRSTIINLQNRVTAIQQKEFKETAGKNLSEGKAFLEENKKKDGVHTLASGLQYSVLNEGSGLSPKLVDKVKVNYKGILLNGTEIDSTYSRGEAMTLPVNGLIKGWTEALQMMREGSKWRLFIPAELAYGEKQAGSIPPNSTLIFEIELLSVLHDSTAATTKPSSDPKSGNSEIGPERGERPPN
jgi:FKBP-type peptidyl-prolyl cis-trans isomerase FklB